MSYPKLVYGKNVVVFVVDQWIFERDIDRGLLGEALASHLIFPYNAVTNADYLHQQEVALKVRLILELLENMVIGFPELSYRLHIRPEYFMYEVMLSRVRVFPPLAYGLSNFLCGGTHDDKVEVVLAGYVEALKQLESARQLIFKDGYVTIAKEFIKACKNPRVRFTNIFKNPPRTIFSSVFGLFPQMLNFFVQNSEAFQKLQQFPWKMDFEARRFVNPQEYVYVPTSRGLVSLAEKTSITEYAKSVLKDGAYSKFAVEEFGGVLNDVYLIRACRGSEEKKVLVKRFKDWSSFKWFPLSLWSVGAKDFAVLGKSRLERECAIGELLAREGFNVPKVLHVSHNERLVFMEFAEGEDLSNDIKRIALAQNGDASVKELVHVSLVGENYARVHALNVTLGDTKPENVMVTKEGKIILLDFEQASRDGDKTWDIAEFLYFSAHYVSPNSEHKAEAIAQAFITGYLKAGGNASVVRKAATTKYTRVFSIWALPSVIRIVSTICKETGIRK